MIAAAISQVVCVAFAADVDKERDQLKQLQQQISELGSELGETQQIRDAETAALRDVESQIGEISADLHAAEIQIEASLQQIDLLQQQMKPLEENIRAQQRLLRQQVRAAYMMGRQQHLKMLLSQDDPYRVSRVLSYYNYFNRARVSIIDDVSASYDELKRTVIQIEQQQRQVQIYRDEQQQLLGLLDEKRSQREMSLATLEGSLKSKSEQMKLLQEDSGRLEDLIKQLVEDVPVAHLAGRGKSFASLKGKAPWPMKGNLLKRFGERLPGDVLLEGVVVAAPEGERVRAIHDGRVVFADWLRGYGLMLILEHDNGYMSLYGYNQSLLKSVGEQIQAGEIISLTGNSGGHRSPALYFGIRKGSSPINPLRWCVKPNGRRVG